MSKKSLIILITLLLILFGGAIAYLLLSIKPSSIVDTTIIDENTGNPFPFGNGTSNGGKATTTGGTGSTGKPLKPVAQPALRHLSLVPVAGAGIYDTASSTQIRHIERGTGYIYQSRIGDTEQAKLSNTPIIKIYEAFWTDKSSSVVIQKLKEDGETVDSFLITMSSPSLIQSTSTSLTGSLSSKITSNFLGSNMQSIAFSPKKDRIAYLTPSLAGGVIAISAKTDGSSKVQIFDSPLKSWSLTWPSDNTLAFTTKALSNSPGFLYFVSTATNASAKILGGIDGLTTLTNTDATRVLFSKSVDGGITTQVFDVKLGRTEDAGFTTLPEKCVWSKKEKTVVYCGIPLTIPRENYPDAWYKGKVFFNDEIWKIDTLTGIFERVADLRAISGQDIDVTNLILNNREDLLVFINKTDLTLWSLELR